MAVTIRPANPETDYTRMAALLSAESNEPVTEDALRDEDARRVPGKLLRRWVAADSNGVIGCGIAIKYPSEPADLFHLVNVVDAARRGQGIGSQMHDHLLAFLVDYPVGRIMAEVGDRDAAAKHFAEQRGFEVSYHVFDSQLDLTAFDESRFAGTIESAEASGIRFITLQEAGNDEAAHHKLYAINRMTALDEPGSTGTFPTYENWRRIVLDGPWYDAAGQFIALDGEQFVGIAGSYRDPGQLDMFSGYTGVEPAYRGRGIAQALKLVALRYAKARGARRITTENDARNAPMLAINRKLGFQPLPGRYVMLRTM